MLAAEPAPEVQQRRRQQRLWRAQGRLSDEDIVDRLAIEQGLPLAEIVVSKKQKVTVGIDYYSGEGHALVIGQTRSGKGAPRHGAVDNS